MEVISVIIGVLLILVALAIVGAVLLQSSKNARQSGVISGSAEAFFGKSKGKAIDRKLNRITMVLCIVFVALVLSIYVLQPDKAHIGNEGFNPDATTAATTTVATTTTAATTTAATTTAATTTAATTTAATDAPADAN